MWHIDTKSASFVVKLQGVYELGEDDIIRVNWPRAGVAGVMPLIGDTVWSLVNPTRTYKIIDAELVDETHKSDIYATRVRRQNETTEGVWVITLAKKEELNKFRRFL